MIFSKDEIDELRESISLKLSKKRYKHTVGVERAAVKIAKYCLPESIYEISAAALLHDISKEYSVAEQLEIINAMCLSATESDMQSAPIYHSLTAPCVIKRDFLKFSTHNILSAAYNHTTGSPDMSLFDEIIFVSDYVEEGRTYPSCISVREKLFSGLERARDREECISYLHDATIESLDFTIINVIQNKNFLHEKTVMTRNAFLGRRPEPLTKKGMI